MKTPHLIPRPKKIQLREGVLTEIPPPVSRRDASLPAQGYRLSVAASGVAIAAADDAGEFYARQTLDQLRRQSPEGLPFLEIEDYPDYPVRGLYHDVTRGKVPTLETLKHITDVCAGWKLNQLQLYIEHTFAYEAFPEVWRDADPLTADEIRELDAYCLERHIELVPSFSTFGHFYPFIRTPRFQHLNELERDVSGEPFTWPDRMKHYTLDCGNPESIQLVETLIREVRPLFRSDRFNICADETFDLGKGRNRADAEREGVGRLYLDFVNKIIRVVKDSGSTPMMWGDIVGTHPELLSELEGGVVLLDWAYSADLRDSYSNLMRNSGRPFYVCPGTSSWNTFLPDYANAADNIRNFALRGHEHGAEGFLITDWGDYGHIAPLAASWPGIALAAACAWNLDTSRKELETVEATISRLHFGDTSGELCTLLRQTAACCFSIWQAMAFWKQPRSKDLRDDMFDPASGLPTALYDHDIREHARGAAAAGEARVRVSEMLKPVPAVNPRDRDDLLFSLAATRTFHELGMVLLDRAGRNPEGHPVRTPQDMANALKALETEFDRIWHARNKPSEYREIRTLFNAIISDLLS